MPMLEVETLRNNLERSKREYETALNDYCTYLLLQIKDNQKAQKE